MGREWRGNADGAARYEESDIEGEEDDEDASEVEEEEEAGMTPSCVPCLRC